MIQNTSQPVAIIDTAEGLARFLDSIGRPSIVAVDTEFARERTYFARLCLVQIAAADHIALVDTLAIDDLSALAALWTNPDTTTIIHAAAQDLEVLYQRLGTLPAAVFDTQIAAALAGYQAQTGYAALVKAELGVELAKSHTRIDWQRRPLPDGALDYAADDVRYLPTLHARLSAVLAESARTDWLSEECRQLNTTERYSPRPAKSARFVRGLDTLDSTALESAARLAAWREQVAIDTDRPRRWILADEALLELAAYQPASPDELSRFESLPAKTRKRYGAALTDVIQKQTDVGDVITLVTTESPTPETRRRIKAGMTELRRLAEELDVASAVLGSRADVEALAAGQRDTRLESGWRADRVGPAIIDIVAPSGADIS